ncbi:MAG: hypothetical protein K2Y39_19440 [Candidatus Obscuribacterales bacterium]|nr:hypothetical protein [Candidatus Obscuribacterales bacterium]
MKFPRRQLAKRDARGSMLFLCIAVLAVMLVIVALAFSFYLVFFSHKNLQSRSEDLALKCARQLNENDHGGKINNLIAHSRELVFTSRELYRRTDNDEFRGLQSLAAQVLEQSRSGALLVKDERNRYVDVCLQNLKKVAKDAEKNDAGLFLSKFSTSAGEVVDLRVGDMGQTLSNVEASSGVYNLNSYDRQQNFVKPGKEAELFVSNVNLKLPGEDSDLEFQLASLPGPVKGIAAPLRLTRGNGFKNSLVLRSAGQDGNGKCQVIPSAVQVTMSMNVKQSIVGEFDSKTKTVNTACANGAWAEP